MKQITLVSNVFRIKIYHDLTQRSHLLPEHGARMRYSLGTDTKSFLNRFGTSVCYKLRQVSFSLSFLLACVDTFF